MFGCCFCFLSGFVVFVMFFHRLLLVVVFCFTFLLLSTLLPFSQKPVLLLLLLLYLFLQPFLLLFELFSFSFLKNYFPKPLLLSLLLLLLLLVLSLRLTIVILIGPSIHWTPLYFCKLPCRRTNSLSTRNRLFWRRRTRRTQEFTVFCSPIRSLTFCRIWFGVFCTTLWNIKRSKRHWIWERKRQKRR